VFVLYEGVYVVEGCMYLSHDLSKGFYAMLLKVIGSQVEMLHILLCQQCGTYLRDSLHTKKGFVRDWT